MKILFVINALTVGGAQTLLLDLAKYCKEKKNEVIVAAFRDGKIGDNLKENGIKSVILGESFFDLIAYHFKILLIYRFYTMKPYSP